MNEASLIGQPAPAFEMPAVGIDGNVRSIKIADYSGRWLVLLFYPRDFSIVCPTELTAFSARLPEFEKRQCAVLGVSVDSVQVHQQWLSTPISDGGVGPLQFPLASDELGAVASAYRIWNPEKKVSLRGLYVIDPEGQLQYGVTHNLSVGRSVDEVIRVIDALQSGGLCPVSWTRADGTIDVEEVLQPGRVIGHYKIQKKLGKGSFGSVFAAWDERLKRDVAIKVLRKNALESRGELLEEARATARLQHPNVATVFAIEEEDGLPLIAMERIEGKCLGHLIAEGLDKNRQRTIAIGIAKGMAAAHAESIVHGDLKPANVIVLPDETPKILDFGLSRVRRAKKLKNTNKQANPKLARAAEPITAQAVSNLDYASLEETTVLNRSVPIRMLAETAPIESTDGIRGTPLYMSPEQFHGQLPTFASDVFSFGLMYYEMVTGHRALPESSLNDLLQRLESPEFAAEISAEVPSQTRDMLRSALSKDPKQRPSMKHIVKILEQ